MLLDTEVDNSVSTFTLQISLKCLAMFSHFIIVFISIVYHSLRSGFVKG